MPKNKICPLTSVAFVLIALFTATSVTANTTEIMYDSDTTRFHPVYAKNGMVVSADTHATRVGVDILKQGGNAIDAAIGVGLALAVTYPEAGNLGGGGFMVIRTKEGNVTTIDFRETAPAGAQRDMFLDETGKVNSQLSLNSPLAVGVPGTVAGFDYALNKYGTQSLETLIAPAYKLANEGFIVDNRLASILKIHGRKVLRNYPKSKEIFFKTNNNTWEAGDLLVQKNLANSLQLIAKEGAAAFYKGEIAQQISQEMASLNGLITLADLENYKVIERKPVTGTYRGYHIYSMPAPSSGGIHIIQLLNILENTQLKSMGQNSANAIHYMAEAMKYAYADRSKYLGDPDFTPVPTSQLTSKAYARTIYGKLRVNATRPSYQIEPGNVVVTESDQTTHYSVVDQWGNAVAVTYTLNTHFGSGIVAGNTGILLNNEMDDFSALPGHPNTYGLTGGEANAIQAGKRPLSSMSPTIVTDKNDKLFMVTGSPGGSRIITTVLQIILNVLEFDMNIAEATNAPRIHHQWQPDVIRIESGLSPDTIKILRDKRQGVALQPTMGSAQSIMVSEDGFYGASDPRTIGGLAAGY